MWPGTIERLDIISSNPNPLIRHFAPTWNSLKRIIDLPYIAMYGIQRTDLPVYEITLSKQDKENLFDSLPDYPRKAAMWEEYKKTAKGAFRTGDYYTNEAKIRIRGVGPNHWNSVKKSWQINLPQENPLTEREVLRLFLPEDKGWIFNAMNAKRAREFGLISPEVSYVRLRINTVDMGVYHLMEGWEESMLENNGRGLAPLFSNLNLDIRNVDLLRPDSLHIWENRFAAETPPESQEILSYFLDLVANAPDEIFEKELPHIMDMEMFYRWLTITALSGSFHQGNGANQNWYVHPATGKLEPILFDTALRRIDSILSVENNRLVSRTMRIPVFNAAFTEVLKNYLADSAHKNDALSFYDGTFNALKKDIVSDTKKIQTSAEVLGHIPLEQDTIQHNYDELQRMLSETGVITFKYAAESYPVSRSFDPALYKNSFLAHRTSEWEFLRANPQFKLRSKDTLALSAGTHIFRTNVIIPEGYTVVINPGAHLLFAPGISLFSYSTVMSSGTAKSPVLIKPLNPTKPWGVFAVINAPHTSVFKHTHIQDGKDASFTGLYFSGSLSMRASDLDFIDSSITRSRADDGIHIYGSRAYIAQSTFTSSSMDSIDIDFAKIGSLFEKNRFQRGGGDAIDLSFSETIVRENTITECGDKGISVGEASKPLIEKNTVIGCVYGIAVKDNSHATLIDNLLLANSTGIGLYRKKPHFVKGGRITGENNALLDNDTEIAADEYSTVSIKNSTKTPPNLARLLSPELFSIVQKTLDAKHAANN